MAKKRIGSPKRPSARNIDILSPAFSDEALERAGMSGAETTPCLNTEHSCVITPLALTRAQVNELKQIGTMISKGVPSETVIAGWKSFLNDTAPDIKNGSIDLNAFIQMVVSEAYTASMSDLQYAAEKVKYFNNLKDQIRNDILKIRRQMEECASRWEEKLAEVGDDAQLANVDLQNILQKQQQTLQMMSNISKMLYDTAMAVIRKIGG